MQGYFGLWSNAGPRSVVVVDFDASVAASVASRSFHCTQQNEPLKNGGLRVRLELANTTEVCGWILGFGATAIVVEPASLRATVQAALRAAIDRYDAPAASV